MVSPAPIRPATPPLATVALVRVGAVLSTTVLKENGADVLAGVTRSLAVMLEAYVPAARAAGMVAAFPEHKKRWHETWEMTDDFERKQAAEKVAPLRGKAS